MRSLWSVVAALACLPGAVAAETFAVPLPDLVRDIDFPACCGGLRATFDFGQSFSEIQNVWIEVEAQVFPLEYDVCGTVLDPQECVHHVSLLGLVSIMDEQESETPGIVYSDALAFTEGCNPYEGHGLASAVYNNPIVGWEFLLDGEGALTLFWNDLLGNPDRIIKNVVQPSGEIWSARLIVEATPVPEPSAGILGTAAALVLLAMRRLPSREDVSKT